MDASISGATEKTDYYISLGVYNQEGTAPNSDMERYNITFDGPLYNDVFKIHKVRKTEGFHN